MRTKANGRKRYNVKSSRIIHDRLRVAVVLFRVRGRGVDGEAAGAADGVCARKGGVRGVDGKELGGGRGVLPAAAQEE